MTATSPGVFGSPWAHCRPLRASQTWPPWQGVLMLGDLWQDWNELYLSSRQKQKKREFESSSSKENSLLSHWGQPPPFLPSTKGSKVPRLISQPKPAFLCRKRAFRTGHSWLVTSEPDHSSWNPLGASTLGAFSSVSSVAQSCPTLCDPMNHSPPGLPVHHQLPEFTQTHVHWVSDAIQPSHPLSTPSPPVPNPSQHQDLFQWVNSSHEVAKVLEFQLQHQSFQWTPRTDVL